MTNKQRDVETMAERWQRVKPATYFRSYYDGKQDHGITEFLDRLMKIDADGKFKLVDGGTAVEIRFSDGSSYRMNPPTRQQSTG
jgi:hypothetical protein